MSPARRRAQLLDRTLGMRSADLEASAPGFLNEGAAAPMSIAPRSTPYRRSRPRARGRTVRPGRSDARAATPSPIGLINPQKVIFRPVSQRCARDEFGIRSCDPYCIVGIMRLRPPISEGAHPPLEGEIRHRRCGLSRRNLVAIWAGIQGTPERHDGRYTACSRRAASRALVRVVRVFSRSVDMRRDVRWCLADARASSPTSVATTLDGRPAPVRSTGRDQAAGEMPARCDHVGFAIPRNSSLTTPGEAISRTRVQ